MIQWQSYDLSAAHINLTFATNGEAMFNLTLTLAGGLGMLLLGMKLMTDGLKLAGGPMLRDTLAQGTRTPLRGLFAGFSITAIIQSSGAVTVATIGFVNAGLMALHQAVWVIYGSNVGTTITAWIVVMLGLKIKIKLLAMPMIALGTGMWIAGRVSRRSAFGEAIAGFGLFFVGISSLQNSMQSLHTAFPLEHYASGGIEGMLAMLAIGFLLTCLMQSSSASLILILTAASADIISLSAAGTAVIGANVGSTSTAAISVIGATPNAKRLAALHVIFNLITGVVACLILSGMLDAIVAVRSWFGLGADAPVVLALFHTTFNILGILLLWPMTRTLVKKIKKWFRTQEEEQGRPRYLDSTVLRTPSLAIPAMIMEVGRIHEVCSEMVMTAARCKDKDCPQLQADKAILDRLQQAIGKFAVKMSQEGLPENISNTLPQLLRVTQYFYTASDTALAAQGIKNGLKRLPKAELRYLVEELAEDTSRILSVADPEDGTFSGEALEIALEVFERDYQKVKEKILSASSAGLIPPEQMVLWLEYLSNVRRMTEQVCKAALLSGDLRAEYEIHKTSDPQDGTD